MSIGQNIRRRRTELDMTLEEVASRIGCSRQTVSRYENGVIGNIPSDKIEAIATVLLTTPAALMGWEAPLPANMRPLNAGHRVPRLGRIACGEPVLAEENYDGYDDVPDWIVCDFTLVCKGDSMTGAHIRDGDIVCIKQQEEVENGQIAAIRIDGEYESEATLKRVRFVDGGVALWPENPAYAPMIFTGEDVNKVHIIGLATHFIARVR